MYIMCVCLFSALSRRVGALQIPIIIQATNGYYTVLTNDEMKDIYIIYDNLACGSSVGDVDVVVAACFLNLSGRFEAKILINKK